MQDDLFTYMFDFRVHTLLAVSLAITSDIISEAIALKDDNKATTIQQPVCSQLQAMTAVDTIYLVEFK